MVRLDSLFPGASFRLDGDGYTVRHPQGNMVVCEREDGYVVYLHGWEEVDTREPRRSFASFFHAAIP